jgi:hypothetical protein
MPDKPGNRYLVSFSQSAQQSILLPGDRRRDPDALFTRRHESLLLLQFAAMCSTVMQRVNPAL